MSDSPRFHNLRRELNLNESQSYSIVSIDKSSGPNFSSTPHDRLMLNDVDLTLAGNEIQPAPDQVNNLILETENVNDFTSLSEESNRRINTLAFSINKQRALQLHPSKQSKSLPNTPLHAPKKVNFNYSQSVQSVSRPSNISSQIKKENKVLDLKEAIRINFINKLVQQSKKPSVGDAMKKYIKYGIPNQELDDLRRHPELSALVHPIRKKSKQVGERRRSIKDFI